MTVTLIQRHISSTNLFSYHADIVHFSDIYSERFDMDHSQYLSELLLLAFFLQVEDKVPKERILQFLEEMAVEVVMELYKTGGWVANSNLLCPLVSSVAQALQEVDLHAQGNTCTLYFFSPRDVKDPKEVIKSEHYLIGRLDPPEENIEII